jgi:hypothetical protein
MSNNPLKDLGEAIGGLFGGKVGGAVGGTVGEFADDLGKTAIPPDVEPVPAPPVPREGKRLIQSRTVWGNVALAAGMALLTWGAGYDWSEVGPVGATISVILNVLLRVVTALPIRSV